DDFDILAGKAKLLQRALLWRGPGGRAWCFCCRRGWRRDPRPASRGFCSVLKVRLKVALADAAIFSAAVEAGDFLQADAVLVSHGTHDGAVEALAVGARHGRVALWPALLGIGFCLGAYCYGFFFLAGFTV